MDQDHEIITITIIEIVPLEERCYTQLQPVNMDLTIGSLIASSTNMCLPHDSCSDYNPASSHYNTCSYSSDESQPPQSPGSVYEEELSDIQEVLQTRMTGSQGDDDDDDKSVMLDIDDLSFLDTVDAWDSRHGYPSVIVSNQSILHHPHSSHRHPSTLAHPYYHHHHYSPSPARHVPHTSTSSSAVSESPYRRHPSGTDSVSAWNRPLYYYDSVSPCQPSPRTPSLSPRVQQGVGVTGVTGVKMEEEEEEEDADFKPYCESRRGAKKNLLWKFLLMVLDHHQDLAQWTDMQEGVFKFLDTARLSTMWGQRKHKTDMTFEKLSRGIRHYYKRGLMERLSNTRLVYRFNWEKVPKRFRKA